jgi:condensation enzyme
MGGEAVGRPIALAGAVMTDPGDAADSRYVVLVNSLSQYSLWPAAAEVPGGWSVACAPADRATCLGYVTEHWKDPSAPAASGTRPLSPGMTQARLPNQFPLSFNQEFLCAVDKGDLAGSFGHRHIMANGWRLSGEIDAGALQGALDDVVARHEILRTSVKRDGADRYQEIHPPMPVPLHIRELALAEGSTRQVRAEELLNEVEAGTLSVRDLPLLRAVLGRFDDTDSVLALVAHHTATDEWSMQLIIRDLLTFYAARRGQHAPALPEVSQYREFAAAQRAEPADAGADWLTARGYWRDTLRGARIFTMPAARDPAAHPASSFTVRVSVIDAELAAAAARFSRELNCTPFMVLLAAFYILARKTTGQTDLTVPTFSLGRNDPRFLDTVGFCVNFLPVRTSIPDRATFREIAAATRESCLGAYSHDIPFAHIGSGAPELMSSVAADRALLLFEVVQTPGSGETVPIGGISYHKIARRLLPPQESSDLPGGMLWALEFTPSSEILGFLQYNRAQFDEQSIDALASQYERILRESLAAPDERRESGWPAA